MAVSCLFSSPLPPPREHWGLVCGVTFAFLINYSLPHRLVCLVAQGRRRRKCRWRRPNQSWIGSRSSRTALFLVSRNNGLSTRDLLLLLPPPLYSTSFIGTWIQSLESTTFSTTAHMHINEQTGFTSDQWTAGIPRFHAATIALLHPTTPRWRTSLHSRVTVLPRMALTMAVLLCPHPALA